MFIKVLFFLSFSFLSSFTVFNLSVNETLENIVDQNTQNDLYNDSFVQKEESILEDNYSEKILFWLEIPKIKVKNKVYEKDSFLNDIDKNVQLMNESDLPDDSLGNVIIGGHSGTGPLAYFKNLHLLNLNDEIIIKYNNVNYIYYVKKIYKDDKDGSIVIKRDYSKDTLTLFTCNPNDKFSFLVIIAEKM